MLTDPSFDPLAWRHQGYMLSYHEGEINHCPGCGRHNWILGRLMAECAFCETALPLEHVHGYGARQRVSRQGEAFDLPPEELRPVS